MLDPPASQFGYQGISNEHTSLCCWPWSQFSDPPQDFSEQLPRHRNLGQRAPPRVEAACVGAEHVAFGSDYVHDIDAALALIASNPVAWPKEMYDSKTGVARPQITVPGVIWGVVRVLEQKYGWTEEQVRGFLGENVLRVYKANWQPAN